MTFKLKVRRSREQPPFILPNEVWFLEGDMVEFFDPGRNDTVLFSLGNMERWAESWQTGDYGSAHNDPEFWDALAQLFINPYAYQLKLLAEELEDEFD